MNTTIQKLNLLIGGQDVPAKSGRYFDAINPSNGEVIAQMADASLDDVREAIVSARRSFDQNWRNVSVTERGQELLKVAQLIREHAKELAELECLNTGKTLKQTTFIDVPTAADTFEYFGANHDMLQGDVIKHSSPALCLTEREPMGVVVCIIPWNYPLIMAAWKIAPALMCGNSVILKPSKLAAVSLLRLGQWIAEAGLLKGRLSIIVSQDSKVASALVESPDVDMVSFSGGTETGQKIMTLAAKTTKKVVLELGGKSPNIVFNDCDVDAAIGGTLSAIFMNQGQMCTAGSRLLVEDKMYDSFVGKLVERAKTLKIGPAINFDTEFGPIISREHRDKILSYIQQGHNEGAKLLCGGKIPSVDEQGFYLEPTIFGDVKNSMTIAQEEIFGPVLSVIRFSSEEEAIKIANDSKYGLASMIWTKDLEKANRVARHLRCGTVWINTYGFFPNEAPFGGYKQSGFGRELGREGLLEYTQVKNIATDQTPGGTPLVSAWF